METSEPIRRTSPLGDPCTQAEPEGPCSIELTAYDALAFFQNPSGAAPLPADIVIDDCGRYLVSDFPVPSLGFVAFAMDDASANDNMALSARTSGVSEGRREHGFSLYVVRNSTDQAWTASAGDPFSGQTFSERGVFAAIFVTGAVPTSGVMIARWDGAHPEDDYYFSDVDPSSRTSIDPQQTVTGENGSGLMIDSTLEDHTGMGGELAGCYWPSALGKSLSGAVIVQEFHLLNELSGQPCLLIFSDGFESGDDSAWSNSLQ
jgi:hypothetical protein